MSRRRFSQFLPFVEPHRVRPSFLSFHLVLHSIQGSLPHSHMPVGYWTTWAVAVQGFLCWPKRGFRTRRTMVARVYGGATGRRLRRENSRPENTPKPFRFKRREFNSSDLKTRARKLSPSLQLQAGNNSNGKELCMNTLLTLMETHFIKRKTAQVRFKSASEESRKCIRGVKVCPSSLRQNKQRQLSAKKLPSWLCGPPAPGATVAKSQRVCITSGVPFKIKTLMRFRECTTSHWRGKRKHFWILTVINGFVLPIYLYAYENSIVSNV